MTNATDLIETEDRDLSEVERLLNDPDVPMQAERIWELLDKVSARERSAPH